MRVIAHAVRTLSLGMVALLGVGTLTAVAAPPVPPSVAKGNNWNVEPVAGGYRLTLRLDAPAPMRASLPLLAADGVPLGVAKPVARPAHAHRSDHATDLGRMLTAPRPVTACHPHPTATQPPWYATITDDD